MIFQLANQLSTRLSYAYVKVKHGWETRSLDEVEILAAQEKARAAVARAGQTTGPSGSRSAGMTGLSRGSSSLSEGQPLPSPGPSELGAQRTPSRISDDGGAGRTGEQRTFGPLAAVEQKLQGAYGAGTTPHRTYESFWRDHGASSTSVSRILEAQRAMNASTRVNISGGSVPAAATGAAASSNRPSPLAPPAPIAPSKTLQDRRRRKVPYRGYHPPPSIPAVRTGHPNGISDLGNMSSTTGTSAAFPTTPPPRRTPQHQQPQSARTPLLRTPSDKTAMEQDAVETLVYLSSPVHANPQSRPSMYPRLHGTPSTVQRMPPPRRNIYLDDDDDDDGVDPEEKLDRMLDAMSSPDEVDDDDDDGLDSDGEDSS